MERPASSPTSENLAIDIKNLPSLEQAWQRIAEAIERRPRATPLRRTLAELCGSPACFRLTSPVAAERDLPASDVTAMDGYALGPASALAAERGEELTVDGTVGAGARPFFSSSRATPATLS